MESVVSYPDRGKGGRSNYRGNCSPRLIEDIINQFQFQKNKMSLNDYMCGSGTTMDVCKRLGVESTCYDLNKGFDMMSMDIPERPQNIFWHPPYDNIIVYSDHMYKAQDIISNYGFDPRVNDLSRCNGWEDFVTKMNYCMNKQFASLEKGGRMFVLMGDIKKKGKLYSMLCDIAKPGTLEQIVIKMQHNCVSDGNSYAGRFIPIVHEYLMIVRKDQSMIYNIGLTNYYTFDMRNSKNATWRDVVASVLEDNGDMTLQDIYESIDGFKKCKTNQYWHEKIRQVLRAYPNFVATSRGTYRMVA